MSKKGKIKLVIGTHVFYMDGMKRNGGYVQTETKAVGGIIRTVSGKAAEVFEFSGRIAPEEKSYAWGALTENGCSEISFTADGVTYSGYILTSLEMSFEPDRFIGSIKIQLRGAG